MQWNLKAVFSGTGFGSREGEEEEEAQVSHVLTELFQ